MFYRAISKGKSTPFLFKPFGHFKLMIGKTIYSQHLGQYVRVVTDSGPVFGMLEAINLNEASLRPSLVSITTEYLDKTWIEEENPTTVSYTAIKGMQRVPRVYLENICEEAKLIDKIKRARLQKLLLELEAESRQLELFPKE